MSDQAQTRARADVRIADDAQAKRRAHAKFVQEQVARIQQIDTWPGRSANALGGLSWLQWRDLPSAEQVARCGDDYRLLHAMRSEAMEEAERLGSQDKMRARSRQELVDSITLTDEQKAQKKVEFDAWRVAEVEDLDQILAEGEDEQFMAFVELMGFDPEQIQTAESLQDAMDKRSTRRRIADALDLDPEIDWTDEQLEAAAEHRAAERRLQQKIDDELRSVLDAPTGIVSDLTKAKKRELTNEYLALQRSAGLEMPEMMTLTELQNQPDPDHKFAIDRLWPAGGNVLFAAQRKAGKTTVVGNGVRALVDGEPFLDEFAVPERKRVALLDFELSTSMLRGWLADQGIKNTDNLTVISMSGQARSFNILDDGMRSRWAKMLKGHDVLIIDPLRPILHALGLNEWNETGPFLQAFDALRREAGIAEGMIVQHHGHHSERAAGDSNLVGWADANWNITRDDPNDPRSFRFFDAYGRDVDVQKGLVSMYDGRRIAFAADASAAKEDVVTERIVDLLTTRGSLKRADLLKASIPGLTEKTFTATMTRAAETGMVTVEIGDKNAKIYSATSTP